MKLRYQDFVDRIDCDQVYQFIGFEPMRSSNGDDIGHCIWPNNHTNGDTTGKFAINRDKKVYNCWVCEGGSLLSLIMEFVPCDMDTATDILYGFTKQPDDLTDDLFAKLHADPVEGKGPPTMPYFNPRILEQFDGPRDYFYHRGLSDETVDKYHLCMDPEATRYGPRDAVYVGPAAIFPHFWKDRLVGWQSRWMNYGDDDFPEWIPKYTNTHDFPKNDTLFNFDQVLDTNMEIIVVESVPTALLLAQYELPAIAYFGSKITDHQRMLLRGFQQGLIFVPDNDKAGIGSVEKAAKYLASYVPVWVADPVDLFPKADLSDYLETSDPLANVVEHLSTKVHPWIEHNTNS